MREIKKKNNNNKFWTFKIIPRPLIFIDFNFEIIFVYRCGVAEFNFQKCFEHIARVFFSQKLFSCVGAVQILRSSFSKYVMWCFFFRRNWFRACRRGANFAELNF